MNNNPKLPLSQAILEGSKLKPIIIEKWVKFDGDRCVGTCALSAAADYLYGINTFNDYVKLTREGSIVSLLYKHYHHLLTFMVKDPVTKTCREVGWIIIDLLDEHGWTRENSGVAEGS